MAPCWCCLRFISGAPLQLRDQSHRPASRQGAGDAPFQSVEGLSFGADLVVRYAIDSSQIAALASKLPDNIEGELVEPAVQGCDFQGAGALHGTRNLLVETR